MEEDMQEKVQGKRTLKEKLKLVFDDDLRTTSPEWKNWADYVIIGLIVVSTIGVFLSTFDVLKKYSHVLDIIEVVTVAFFTIEIALRIWSADTQDDKYKGFKGRVRYCLSFYGLIDLISVVPFYINLFLPSPSAALRIMRVFRFMRLFHYMKSSRLLFNAISSKKNELTISLSFLTLLTVVLSVLLYFVEHEAQPEQCENGWQTFVWAFAKYLGDPGKIADFTLETPAANFIAFIVGILGVAIFAVPTGIISSGITEALGDDKKAKELKEYYRRMRKAFRRDVNLTLRRYLSDHPIEGGGKPFPARLWFSPQRIPVAKIQLRQGIDLKDIFNVCKEYPEFRIKNLADAFSSEEQVDDRFVVEHFPYNRPYGYSVDRNSRVTIVSTGSYSENGTGWFSYYLAKMGGFNYVSKDIEVDPDELDSFFNMTKEPLYERKPSSHYKENKKENKEAIEMIDKKKENRKAFLDDLNSLAKGDDAWVIVITAHLKNSQNKFDFHFAATKKDGSDSTVSRQDIYEQLCLQLSQMLEKDYGLTCDLRSQRYPTTKNFLGYRLRGEEKLTCNCFVLRPSSDMVCFDDRRLLVAYRMACIISQQLDNGKGMEDDDMKDFEESSFGYSEKERNPKSQTSSLPKTNCCV